MERIVTNWLKAAIIASLFFFLPSGGEAQACSATRGASTFTAIQAAVNSGGPSTILVSGTCVESVSLGSFIALDGQGIAILQGTNPTNGAISVNGDSTIQNFASISGGQDGIRVLSGGTPRIVDNIIENNTRDGILLLEGSTARIGILRGDDATARPNTIQNNGRRGITVARSSAARIVGNTIRNNVAEGIAVVRVSQADIASNTIAVTEGTALWSRRIPARIWATTPGPRSSTCPTARP